MLRGKKTVRFITIFILCKKMKDSADDARVMFECKQTQAAIIAALTDIWHSLPFKKNPTVTQIRALTATGDRLTAEVEKLSIEILAVPNFAAEARELRARVDCLTFDLATKTCASERPIRGVERVTELGNSFTAEHRELAITKERAE